MLRVIGLMSGTSADGIDVALCEIDGAPFIDAERLADHLNTLGLPGVRYRPHVFTPTASKYAGEMCCGVQAHRTGPGYRPLAAWVAVIQAIRHQYADDFAWLPPYRGTNMRPFDRLARGEALREHIDANAPLDALTTEWDATAAAWRDFRREALLYPAEADT